MLIAASRLGRPPHLWSWGLNRLPHPICNQPGPKRGRRERPLLAQARHSVAAAADAHRRECHADSPAGRLQEERDGIHNASLDGIPHPYVPFAISSALSCVWHSKVPGGLDDLLVIFMPQDALDQSTGSPRRCSTPCPHNYPIVVNRAGEHPIHIHSIANGKLASK